MFPTRSLSPTVAALALASLSLLSNPVTAQEFLPGSSLPFEQDEHLRPLHPERIQQASYEPRDYRAPLSAPQDGHRPAYPELFRNHLTPTDYHSPNPDFRSPGLPALTPAYPQQAPTSEEMREIQLKLNYRWSNPVNVRFAQQLSASRAAAFYQETGRLIDTRHLQPTSYQARVRRALLNLELATESTAFLQANRLSPGSQQLLGFRQTLSRIKQGVQVRDSRDAVQVMHQVMQLAQSQLGLAPGVVASEFVMGGAETLDEYSAFEPKDSQTAAVETEAQFATLEDQMVGIGVEIKSDSRGVLIVNTIRSGPAANAGLQRGDLILAINGRRTQGLNMSVISDLLSGPSGSPVMLNITRGNQSPTLITLTRQSVRVYTLTDVKMLQAGIGYVKLNRFGKSSAEELEEALWSLHRQGMQGLVFDVRGNPGGLLTTAIEISDKFLPCGTIVSTRGRTTSDNSIEKAEFTKTWKLPLVVLVDADSASASEIFAAAIQDNQRGLVVGRRSYGKGTVQTHFPLESVAGNLRLTTAKFYSPSGREMAGNGVQPDVPVRTASSQVVSLLQDADVREALQAVQSRQALQQAEAAARCQPPVQPAYPWNR